MDIIDDYVKAHFAHHQGLRDVKMGDTILRRRGSDKEPKWLPVKVNATYLELIRKFPEDYKLP